jgi:L-sorbose 1-phosphate reductase
LNDNSIFCWLPDKEPSQYVKADIAKVHYHKISWLGSATKKLSDAFEPRKQRFDLKREGSLLIVGGAGAMGRFHLLRSLGKKDGPAVVVVTGRNQERLDILMNDFKDLARQAQKRLIAVVIDSEGKWEEKLRTVVGDQGFDDIILCAPGTEPVVQSLSFLANDGMMVFFSGTNFGQKTKVPIGLVASKGARMTASSGSTVKDQMMVLKQIQLGQLDPNFNIAAIGGLYVMKEAIEAVTDGLYSGKIVIFPGLPELPLISLDEIGDYSSELESLVNSNGWSKEAEKLLFSIFKS